MPRQLILNGCIPMMLTQRSVVQVRLTPQVRARVEAAANGQRRTVSARLRAIALDEPDTLDRTPSVTGERDRKRRLPRT